MVLPANRIKKRIGEGKVSLGFVCRSLSAPLVEIVGLSGFDFVWIDMEHTSAGFGIVEDLCRAADATGLEVIVRVPDKNPSNILRALECGAGVVNVPQIEERSQAEAVVRAAKYHPIGERGFCSSSRGTHYGLGGPVVDVFAAANERVMTMIQIESARGVDNAEDICSVSGLDIVFVGLADLSQSLGVLGQLDHPELLASARRVLQAARTNGKITAMLTQNPVEAKMWAGEGVGLICCGVDLPTIAKTLSHIRGEFDDSVRGAAPVREPR
jgi:4-hydroxy-2-oxoheptanedioate aldolase